MEVVSPPLFCWPGEEGWERMSLEVVDIVIAVLILMLTATGLVPVWVPFLEERPHLAARIGRPMRWLSQWWRVVFAAVVLVFVGYVVWNRPEVWLVGLIAAVVFLLLWFIRELATGIRWLGRTVLWKAIIRPARDHFGVEAVSYTHLTLPTTPYV